MPADGPSGASPELQQLAADLFEAASPPRDDPRHALDQLVSRALAYRTGGELRGLLEFTRRFPHLAPFNAMLLHVQNPGIAYALTPRDWRSRYDRIVRPGARPYIILWTMGPVAFVFDLSDTEPRDAANNRVPDAASNPFPAKGQPPDFALSNLKGAARELGIEIGWRDLATHAAGSVRPHSSTGWDFFLQLNSKHSDAQNIGTLAHELAHVFCGHLGETKRGFWRGRPGLALVVREFEAEAVAWMVTERLNIDIGSVEYLAGYLKDDQPLPNFSLDAVIKATGKIEEMIRGRFRSKKKQ